MLLCYNLFLLLQKWKCLLKFSVKQIFMLPQFQLGSPNLFPRTSIIFRITHLGSLYLRHHGELTALVQPGQSKCQISTQVLGRSNVQIADLMSSVYLL